MDYKLSSERIIGALNECNSIIDEDNTIKVLKNKRKIEISKDKIIDLDDEVLNDYLNILKSFKLDILFARYNKNNFIDFLKKIKY